MKFSYIDIFLFAGLGLSVYLGWRGGFTRKLLTLLALLGSVVAATQLMQPVGGALNDIGLFSAPFAYIVGFALVVGVLMTAVILVYRKFGDVSVVKTSSHFLGVALGLIEGALVISLLLLALKVFDVPEKSTRTDSLLYRPLVNFAPKTFDLLRAYLPGAEDFKNELSATFKGSDIFESLPELVEPL